ncbi:MAG: ParB N-terminal domain-containing protein [Solirubrobacterales bacterium]|nr:ParB N-terminal domain-containing protein [Solirubrobacterales bacterium]
MPFSEVVDALGRTGERRVGLKTIPLDTIVGSVDRAEEFDRDFRPRSDRVRARWQRINAAQRRGEGMPPIEVLRVGGLHFVVDGHHRVSVARHLGRDAIEAYVTEITTRVSPEDGLKLADLPAKGHERLFLERVPLSPEQRRRITFSDPAQGFAELAEAVEAWGFRLMQGLNELLDRREVAQSWFEDEFAPVVQSLRDADLIGSGTEADAYIRVVRERYMLLRTHEWDEDVIARLRSVLD